MSCLNRIFPSPDSAEKSSTDGDPALLPVSALKAPAKTMATADPSTFVTTFIFPPYMELVTENPLPLALISAQ